MDILLTALCGALFLVLAFWMLFAVCCFHHAYAEAKEDISEAYEEPTTDTSINLIYCAVDHLHWKSKRGYLWGGGWRP